VLGSYRGLEELLLAYGPQPSYDDMAWYGLAYTRVYEVTEYTQHTDCRLFSRILITSLSSRLLNNFYFLLPF